MANTMTLEEFITTQSLISRRELLHLLNQQLVRVNHNVVDGLSFLVNPQADHIDVKGTHIPYKYGYEYFKFYKPKGILSTMDDPKGRACIGDYIRSLGVPVFPVGRLDRQSVGLMLLTNDGAFSHQVMHPSFLCNKTYMITLKRPLSSFQSSRLESGLFLADGPIQFSDLSLYSKTQLSIATHEGRNRIVRRSVEHVGNEVVSLKRIQIGTIGLEDLKVGEIKPLTKHELKSLKQHM